MEHPATTTVLIADDTVIARKSLRLMLEKDNASHRAIYEACNGREALELYHTVRPDIMLLDIHMPEMGGLDVIAALRKEIDDQDTFIIVLTGADDPELQVRTLNLGANDFLSKSFGPPELLARVAVAERQVALSRSLREYSSRIRQEIELVASLQQKLLPSSSPCIQGVCIEQFYEPSGQASGDYFDYFPVCNECSLLRVVMADVSGHGARAAFIMGIVRTLFRLSASSYVPLEKTVTLINEHLIDIIGTEDDFLTLFAADIDFSEGIISYINAGHCPGMVKRETGEIVRLEATTPLLGFFPAQPVVKELPFAQGSELFLFTDGLYDWKKSDGTLFTLEHLWELAATALRTQPRFLEVLMEQLATTACCSEGFRDDRTALWVKTKKA